ncbi:hypothetical protein [Caulobacter sp. S45]|uniref:hypothetical protein n=1 Tax=Caulobacter sp. S45 TaxID=1641861 RepID=UPI00131B6027|nr:hypothetical protein [Caulobacter sp. S45]
MAKPFRMPGPDRYEVNARLKPALFCVLPLLVLPAAWLPEVWTALGGLSALLVTCGVTVLMAQIARQRGRKLQAKRPDLGPDSSATLLSHADGVIDPMTKARYHKFLATQGLTLPTAAEEAATGPAPYKACVTWLLAETRDKERFHLLAEENIAYGYRRNLFALKPIALTVLAVALAINTTAVVVRWAAVDTRYWIGAAAEVGLIGVMAAWLLAVRPAFVADASRSFGERLLAACDEIPQRQTNKSKRR